MWYGTISAVYMWLTCAKGPYTVAQKLSQCLAIFQRRAYEDVPLAQLHSALPACRMPSQLTKGLRPPDPLAASQQ